MSTVQGVHDFKGTPQTSRTSGLQHFWTVTYSSIAACIIESKRHVGGLAMKMSIYNDCIPVPVVSNPCINTFPVGIVTKTS